MKQFIHDEILFEFLENDIIHIEKKPKNFTLEEDQTHSSLFVINRNEIKRKEFESYDYGSYFTLNFDNKYYLVIEKSDSLSSLKLYDHNQKLIYSYEGIKNNSGELPLPYETPYVFDLFDNPKILINKNGYNLSSFENDLKEVMKVEDEAIDFYLLISEFNPDKLRKQYIALTGRSELVRLKTLGFWNSRYYRYDENSALEQILNHEKHNIPLDNLVIDTDWRKASGLGMGYDIDTTLFPNLKRFFDEVHEKNIEVMFNDHPEPVKGAENAIDKKEVEYRNDNLARILSLGLDYWWYDRNWITRLKTINKNLEAETLGDYIFYDITKHFFELNSNSNEIYKRPLIMCNVNNILNGDYQKINDSASHRYSIQWSGDITSSYDSIAKEVKNLILCENNLVSYYSSDIGGHIGNPNKEEYIRWMQLGTFEPIFRVHCTNCVIRFREPWNYDEETLEISRKYLNLRYRLLPLLYTKSFDNYLDGEPIYKHLSYLYNDEKVKNDFTSYMFADSILISPFSASQTKEISKNEYIGKVKAEFFSNPNCEGKPVSTKTLDELKLITKDGESPVRGVGPYEWSARFYFKLKFKKDTKIIITSDDGCSLKVNGELIHEDKSSHALSPVLLEKTFKRNEVYKLEAELYQHSGMAGIYILKSEIKDLVKYVDLPVDNFINLFTGKIYKDGNKVKFDNENLLQTPLFIKEGSVIPLVKEENNTSLIDYSNILLDIYPSFKNKGTQKLYEDDKVTTSYKYGEYRLTYFSSYFDESENSFIIKISKSFGEFKDYINEKGRNIKVKFNLINLKKEDIENVYLNEEEVSYKFFKKDKTLMPLSFGNTSNIFNTLVLSFKEDLTKEYVIKIKLTK